MKKKSIKTLSILFLFILNTSNVFSQTEDFYLKTTIEYFHQRNEAINLVKKQKWQDAIPILENLTEHYKNDPDLFYLLGLSYYQIEQYQNAIISLKKNP